ncbi:DUF1810 domain-containing protein [Flavobacterium cupreum]|jgi:uncharacterized protein (DUF1810 family)|uniref:DUF1810 domain-containing protein n=1 Tax=Flavobacterium cupreum TaxID=2133766 RepID=A0A434A230_9FLAO|nr:MULTISPECIES: DUF1810 domain-containing protein [Flavobacterium]MCD0467787.1 DUF1810 domain-containing protein [Flavobacterium sp. ENC]RUT68397.1 DUF1810 domain-containing protein [Flavobacterium cupreum]
MAKLNNDLTRFLEAQNKLYLTALTELKRGKKETHWMWFIFPQIKGLGRSEMSRLYSIDNLQQSEEFLAHPVLGKHLIEVSRVLLDFKMKSAEAILGDLDARKLQSSMTLFSLTNNTDPVFQEVLDAFFSGKFDLLTLSIINEMIHPALQQEA